MPSLIGADAGSGVNVAANYLKTSPSTQFGTRALKFLAINVDAGGDSDVDLTAAYASGTGAFSGAYGDSNSYLTKLVRSVQQFAEIYAVGTPTSTDVVIVVADDTANGAEADSHTQATTFGALEAAIKAGLGIGAKAGLATAYNGTVTVSYYSLQGATLG